MLLFFLLANDQKLKIRANLPIEYVPQRQKEKQIQETNRPHESACKEHSVWVADL